MDTTTTWPRASDRVHNATDGGTDIDTQAMEARIREKVVASRRKPKMTLGENTPCLESTTPCLQSPIPTSPIHLPPFHHHIRGNGDMAQPPPRNPESQDVRSRLAAQQKRLAEEIARAKDRLAQLESLKPKSTTDKRMRRRELWPQSNSQAMVIDISDEEEDGDISTQEAGNVLEVVTNHS